MVDMYTRVKRERRSVKRNMYGMPIPDDGEKSTESQGSGEEEDNDEDEETESGKNVSSNISPVNYCIC